MALFDLESPDELYQKSFRQPNNMYLAVDMLWASDSTLICQQADGGDKFVLYNTLGNQLSTYGTWSQMMEDPSLPPNVIKSVHQGRPSINPVHKYISDSDKLNRMFVFDYQGNIVRNYTLDYPLTSFTLDEENGIIYGLTIDQESNVVAFNLLQ